MNKLVATAVLERANDRCECCARPTFDTLKDRATIDHMFGRAKAVETVETCWVLRAECHEAKTQNKPTASQWLLKFIKHCGHWARTSVSPDGYVRAASFAQQKLEWLSAKGFA